MEVKKITPNHPISNESQNITIEKIKKFLPKGSSVKVSESIIEEIRNIENSTGLSQEYTEEKIMSSLHLIGGETNYSMSDLVNAVKYCNLIQHYTNEQAWAITFPARYDKLVSEGRQVASHVSMYNSRPIVSEVLKTMVIPAHISYMPYFHKAVEKQYQLMNGIGANDGEKVSAHVQHLAAKELREITQMPEDNSIELKIGASDAVLEQQKELNTSIQQLVLAQAAQFAKGGKVEDVQKIHMKVSEPEEIIDADI